MNTPENITSLREDEVFVFGSHASGHHGGGAARTAVEKFGALVGQGEGMQGQSYAIPTMGGLAALAEAVSRFLYFANQNRHLRFLVTKLGTGIAGYPPSAIAPLFADRAPNVTIPAELETAAHRSTSSDPMPTVLSILDPSGRLAAVVDADDSEDVTDRCSPDCAVGKHDACGGDAWNPEEDALTTCTCDCHAATEGQATA